MEERIEREPSSPTKKNNRKSYASDVSKHPSQVKKIQCKTIYSVSFAEDVLMITSKHGLVVYSLLTQKQIFSMEGQIWEAAFIPHTTYIVYTIHDPSKEMKNIAHIMDLVTNKNVATITLKFQIEYIKTNPNCIAIASLSQLSILSFPKLKPVYYGIAGNAIRTVFDISQRGLIFAHTTDNSGQLVIHNLTAPITSIKQRKMSTSSIFTQMKEKGYLNIKPEQQSRTLRVASPFSTKDPLVCIKMSPTGGRVAIVNNQGSSIKIFSTCTGQLWETLRVSFQMCKILDMSFDEDGVALACMTQHQEVHFFNSKIDPYDQSYYKRQYNEPFYQQKNTSSLLYLLGFFYSPFWDAHYFSHFKFELPIQKEDEVKQSEKLKEDLEIIIESESGNALEATLMKRNLGVKERSSSLPGIMRSKGQTIREQAEDQQYTPTVYNTVNRIYIGSNCHVWAVRGYYLYVAKFDRFNGGKMQHISTMPIQ